MTGTQEDSSSSTTFSELISPLMLTCMEVSLLTCPTKARVAATRSQLSMLDISRLSRSDHFRYVTLSSSLLNELIFISRRRLRHTGQPVTAISLDRTARTRFNQQKSAEQLGSRQLVTFSQRKHIESKRKLNVILKRFEHQRSGLMYC